MTLDGRFQRNIICVEDGPIDDVTNALLSSLLRGWVLAGWVAWCGLGLPALLPGCLASHVLFVLLPLLLRPFWRQI